MLILPAQRDWKILPSYKKHEWAGSSARRGVKTYGRLTARLHDGHIVWRGWFEDQEDADEFLSAIASGSIRYERELWRLPAPWWHPDIGEDEGLTYEFSTLTFLSTGTGTQSWTVESGWNSADNMVEAIGAGLNGVTGTISTGGAGGVAGCYVETSNLALTVGNGVNYQIGAANGTTGSGTSPTANSWFDNSSTLVAPGGASVTTNCVGSSPAAGGAGGGNNIGKAGGGGGAGGPNGAGAVGGTAGANGGVGGTGDNGDGGVGGTAGTSTAAGGPGGNGTEWQVSPSYGSGGGGGGGDGINIGGNAGNYGAAGGGGGGSSPHTPGAGSGGLIVITNYPAAASLVFGVRRMFLKR